MAVNWKTVATYPIADSQTLTAMDPVKLSSGKVQEDTTSLSSNIIGFSTQTKSMGVLATVGQQEYVGVVTEGWIEVTGMVEGSGGTYKTDFAVGSTVSVYWKNSVPYVVMNSSGPVGKVISIDTADGTLAASGTTADTTGTVTIEVDLASRVADLGAGSVSSVELAAGACTGTTLGDDVVTGVTSSSYQIDRGAYTMNATISSSTIPFSATLTGTAHVFVQALTKTGVIPIPGTITDTNFVITSTGAQTGEWMALIV